MPPLMLHWRLLHITILSLGSIATSAWAADAPSCPSLPQPDAQAQSKARKPASPKPGSPASKLALKETKPGLDEGKIDIESDHAEWGVDGNGKLKGHVVARQGDREVTADEAEYNLKANSFKTDSGIRYDDPLMTVTGNGGTYSPNTGADFHSGTFELKQRAARGSAESLKLTPQGVIDLKDVQFTTCPKTEESWHIQAKSVKLDTTARVAEARSATVDFEGVPIFYMPWMSFPLSNERKSGFLFPTIGNNSRSGASLSVPYYWNIAPNADFTFEPIEYSKRGPDLGGEARYLSSFDHGEITWNYLPYDNVFRSERDRIKLTNVMELPDNFRFTVHAEDVSDTGYFEDFAQGPEGTSTAFIPQQAAVTYRDEHWKVDAEVQHYQTTDITLPDFERPYARLPSIGASADFALGSADQLRYGFESEVVNFNRPVVPRPLLSGLPSVSSCHPFTSGPSQCITGWRIDAMPEASLNFDAPGYFIRPGIAWRATQYELEDSDPNTDPLRDPTEKSDPRRTLPIASFDTGLIFEREAGSHNQRTITLEPRLMYLYVPYRNQDQLPLFDTALPDLDPVELFRNNRYVGADRVGDANQLSFGVTSRLLDAHDGKQFLSATVGQIYYFSNPRVLLPNEVAPDNATYASIPGEVPRTDNRSDFVAQIALTAFQDWNADLGLQWDPQTSQSERSQVNIQYKPSGQAVINVGYRYQRDLLEQAEVSTAWPVSDAWNVFARGVYSLKDDEWLERFAGFEYRSCCWRVRLGVHSFVSNRNGSSDTGVLLQLELSGLAGVGSESDQFLTTAIRGYVPPETALKSQGAVRP
jgi:LPS-assembly protein